MVMGLRLHSHDPSHPNFTNEAIRDLYEARPLYVP
jgi:hypothetical protein